MKRPWATPVATSSWDDGDLASFADEVGALLRSAPDDGVSATRAAVLSAFAAATANGALGASTQSAGRLPWARRPASGLAGLAGAAAMTVVIGVGMVAASTPGGVLYDTRVSLEAVALPSDPNARDDALVDRLGRRLGEMTNAASAHDAIGTLAALQAFTRIAETAALEAQRATSDPDAAQRVLAQVERLVQLAAGQDNPDPAWETAITAGRRLAAALAGGGANPGGGSSSPGASPAPIGSQGVNSSADQGTSASGTPGQHQHSGDPAAGATGGAGPGSSGNPGGTSQGSQVPAPSATPGHDGGQGPSASSGTGGSGPGASQAPGGNGSAAPTGSPSASPGSRTPQPTGSGGPAGSGGSGSGGGGGPGSTGGPTE